MPTSPLPKAEQASLDWPALPTETEIYILPDGRVVIADLPAELAVAVAELGGSPLGTAPCVLSVPEDAALLAADSSLS